MLPAEVTKMILNKMELLVEANSMIINKQTEFQKEIFPSIVLLGLK